MTLTKAIENTEKKLQQAEKYLESENDFMAKKTVEIAFGMAEANMENEDAICEADYQVANTWQERMQAFAHLF